MDIPPIVAGRFQIEHELGRGGMGTVYRARHTNLNRTVAVKVLNGEYSHDPEIVERFMREARTMARLRHAGACVIFDAGALPDGRPYMVMEYAEGETLADVLAAEGRLTPERAVRIAREICEVLQAAHSCGIVHRDLKPSNIMLGRAGVCVLDFGIAKILAPDPDDPEATRTFGTTDTGVLVGTPRYMSPEQCTGERTGPASDLYSVGVLLYEMLTGDPPFTDALASAVLIKQATRTPMPLSTLRPELPRALVFAVHKLLAKHPAQRPVSAAEAASLLERSVRPPRREVDGAEFNPFATTICVLGDSARLTFNRLAALTLMSLLLGTLVFAWSRSNGAGQVGAADEISAVTKPDAGKVRLRKEAAPSATVKRKQTRASRLDGKRR